MKYNPKVIYKIKKYFLKKEKLIEQELKHSPLLIYWGSDSVEKKKKMLVFSHQSKKWGKRLLILTLASALIFSIFKIYSSGLRPARAADVLIKLDEGYGSSANDTNSTVSVGTITGATWRTDDLCRNGKCLFFDGTQDYVSFADDADLDFAAADSFSISFWFRHAPKTSGTEVMVVKLEAVGTDGGYQIQMEADGDITCQIEDDDADTTIDDSISSTAATYDDNRWHYVSCVKSGTSSLTLYIDAVQITQDAALNASSTLANDDTFYIGIDGDGTSNDYTGFIDEVKVYRSARTASEVKADMAGTTPDRGTAASFGGGDQSFLSDGLVGYWKMDEATNTDRLDSSGNGNTVTESTGDDIDGVGGKFGNAGDFENSASEQEYLYITDAGQTGLDITGNMSLCAWIKPETVAWSNIAGKYSGTPNNSYQLHLQANGSVIVYVSQNGTTNNSAASAAGVVTANTWAYVCGIYDGQYLRTYVNGAQSGTPTSYSSGIYNGSSEFRITGAWWDFFDGLIEEVRVYNRALSPAEVNRLYNLGSGLLGWWKMDEESANTCTGGANDSCDSSSFGHDGAWNGNAISTNGKFGNGVIFDGTGDYIDAGDIGL